MTHSPSSRPHIGIGVLLVNSEGLVLIGKRKGPHAPYYSIPGGYLEAGETFEDAAIREVKEETGLDMVNPVVLCVSNNLATYEEEKTHTVSICLISKEFTGVPSLMEPDKCEGWQWCDPSNLPEPHFEASQRAIECFLEGRFYRQG